jgi:hypothetical protein
MQYFANKLCGTLEGARKDQDDKNKENSKSRHNSQAILSALFGIGRHQYQAS